MERQRGGEEKSSWLEIEENIRELRSYRAPDYENIRNRLIAWGYTQSDPRFQGSEYWRVPAWFILKVYNSQVEIRKEIANQEQHATACLGATVRDMFKKKASKSTPIEAFLPYAIEDVDPQQKLLKEKLGKVTARIVLEEFETGRMPSRIAKLVRHSPIYSICKGLTKNG